LNFLDRVFEKYSNIKFHENPFSGSRVVSFGHNGRRDMTKLVFALRIFAKAPNKMNGTLNIAHQGVYSVT